MQTQLTLPRSCDGKTHYQNIFITLKKKPPTPYLPSSSPTQSQVTTNLLFVSLGFLVMVIWTFHVNEIIQHVVCCNLAFLTEHMFSRFIYIVACVNTSFLFKIYFIFNFYCYSITVVCIFSPQWSLLHKPLCQNQERHLPYLIVRNRHVRSNKMRKRNTRSIQKVLQPFNMKNGDIY